MGFIDDEDPVGKFGELAFCFLHKRKGRQVMERLAKNADYKAELAKAYKRDDIATVILKSGKNKGKKDPLAWMVVVRAAEFGTTSTRHQVLSRNMTGTR